MIIDSRAAIAAALDETLLAEDLPALQPGELEPLVGPPIAEGLRALLTARGRSAGHAPAFVRSFRERYAVIAPVRTTVVPQIGAVIAELCLRHRLTVATSKARYLAVAMLETFDLARCFAAIVGPEADALDETKTQTLARAVGLAANSHARVMIGDRHHDITAGRANGCRTIGVTWGIGSRAELSAAGADIIVDTPSGLTSAVS